MAEIVGTYHGIKIGKTASGTIARICSRCSGSGIWGQTMVFGFTARTYVCFKCNGIGLVGKTYLDMPTAIADCAKLEKSRVKAKATRDAKSEARLDAWREANKEMLEAQAKAKAERQAELEVQIAKSVYLSGSVGDRVAFDGVITKAMTFDTNYGYVSGTTRMLIVETADNCLVKMNTSAEWAYGLEEGASVSMVATIKEFSDYRGIKQTVVKSPKILRLEEVEEI
jgi:hypothetical protein